MKRIVCVFVAAIVLAAAGCQPTPEVEFVVNKGDDVVEEKLASPLQNDTAQDGAIFRSCRRR